MDSIAAYVTLTVTQFQPVILSEYAQQGLRYLSNQRGLILTLLNGNVAIFLQIDLPHRSEINIFPL